MAAAAAGWTFTGKLYCRRGRRAAKPQATSCRKITALLAALPLVQVVLFVLLCVVVRWVFAPAGTSAARHQRRVPLVGGVNRLLGLALGLCTGALDCWLLALVLWFLVSVTAGGLDWLNTAVLQRSVGQLWRVQSVLVHY